MIDLIPLILAASEMGDIDLGLPEFRLSPSEDSSEGDEGDERSDDDG